MDYFFHYIFNGSATIATGLVAWIIYLYSKKDKKIEAATILFNEITIAEREIDILKKSRVVSDYTFILPSNHWDDFQHQFVKNFDYEEMKKISDFFKACSLAEESIKLIRSYLVIAMDQKSRKLQDKIIDLAQENVENYDSMKEQILDKVHKEEYYFLPNAPQDKLMNYLQNINQLSLTSIGTKLKEIRDSRWYRINI